MQKMKTRSFQFAEYGQPTDVLQLAEQELPEPGPGQALVRIKAVGLNRSESNYVQGRYIPAREFPSGIGQEAVGEILVLGPPASSIKIGRGSLRLGEEIGKIFASSRLAILCMSCSAGMTGARSLWTTPIAPATWTFLSRRPSAKTGIKGTVTLTLRPSLVHDATSLY